MPSIPTSIVARVSDSTNEDTVGETSYVIQREEILEVSEVDLGDKSKRGWYCCCYCYQPCRGFSAFRRKYSEFERVVFQHDRRNTCVSADPATIPLPEDIPDGLDEIPLFHISETEWKDSTCVMAVAHDESEDAVTKGPLKVDEWQIILGLLIRLFSSGSFIIVIWGLGLSFSFSFSFSSASSSAYCPPLTFLVHPWPFADEVGVEKNASFSTALSTRYTLLLFLWQMYLWCFGGISHLILHHCG